MECVFCKLGCIATTEWGCLIYKDDIRTLSNVILLRLERLGFKVSGLYGEGLGRREFLGLAK